MSKANDVECLVSCDELQVIADLTVKLTGIRQKGCNHLAVENFSTELFAALLGALAMHKQGKIFMSGTVDFDEAFGIELGNEPGLNS